MEGIEASRYIGADGGTEELKGIHGSNEECVTIGTALCNKFFVWVEEDGRTPVKRLVLFVIQRAVVYMCPFVDILSFYSLDHFALCEGFVLTL